MNITAKLKLAVIFPAFFLSCSAIAPEPAEARTGRWENNLQFKQSLPPADFERPQPNSKQFLGRFDARDHTRRVPNPDQQAKPSMFLDMRHQVEVDMEVWHGSTGLKLTW